MLIATVLLLLFCVRAVLAIWSSLRQITYNGDISTRGNECDFLDLDKLHWAKKPLRQLQRVLGTDKPVPNGSLELTLSLCHLATIPPFALK